MSRAVRRQQAAADKAGAAPGARQPKRGFGGLRTPAPTRGARPVASQSRRFRLGPPRWLEDIIAELKKVTWPSREETLYLSMVVIIVAVSVGIFLGGIDLFFSWLIDKLLLN